MKNPFDFLSKIKDPKRFFGRKEILYRLYRMLNNSGNCSVVGPRRIGKSSLLYHMALPDTYSSHLDEAETYVFAFIDLEVIAMLGVDDFLMMAVKRLCQESSGRLQNPPEEYGTVTGFPSFLEEACAKNLKLVLCCDEFESLDPQKGFKCDNGFFSFLRAMSDEYGLTMVTSSRIPLHELCLEGNLPNSPLWNVFNNFPLGLMTEDEMLSLIKEPFARSGISLTEDEISFISDLAGPHPFFLQMACYYLFESKVTRSFPDLSGVREEFLDKAVKYYDSAWGKLEDRQKEGLRCLLVDGILPEKTVLDKLKGNAIVTSQNQISSSGWKQFIKKQFESGITVNMTNLEKHNVNAPTVFISYSHKDREWKDRLVTHLKALEKEGILDEWDDRRIGAGEDWYQEIQRAMDRASVAILMISPDFLSSDFILDKEVSYLMGRQKKEGLHVFPVFVKPCVWRQIKWLARMQLRPKDSEPLSSGDEHEINMKLAAIAEEVAGIIGRTACDTES